MRVRPLLFVSFTATTLAAIACSSSSSPSGTDAGAEDAGSTSDASNDSAFVADGYCASGSITCDPLTDGGAGCEDKGTTYPFGCSGPLEVQGQSCKVVCTCEYSYADSLDGGNGLQWSCPL